MGVPKEWYMNLFPNIKLELVNKFTSSLPTKCINSTRSIVASSSHRCRRRPSPSVPTAVLITNKNRKTAELLIIYFSKKVFNFISTVSILESSLFLLHCFYIGLVSVLRASTMETLIFEFLNGPICTHHSFIIF
jgi:hypothetical protein